MIVTVTLNPCIDRLLLVDNLRWRTKNIVNETHEFVAGKGFTVAKGLATLGIPVTAIGFLGQAQVSWYRQTLEPRGIRVDVTPIAGTRVNTKVIETDTGNETELNQRGHPVSPKQFNQFLQTFDRSLQDADIVVFSGGVSPGLPTSVYADLVRQAHSRNVPAVVDASGGYLRASVNSKPTCLRMNQTELEELVSCPLKTEDDIAATLQNLLKTGSELFLVSRGENGAVLATAQGIWFARCPSLRAINAVGAGDVMTAGLIDGLLRHLPPSETVQWATALASASVLTLESGAVDIAKAREIKAQTRVRIWAPSH